MTDLLDSLRRWFRDWWDFLWVLALVLAAVIFLIIALWFATGENVGVRRQLYNDWCAMQQSTNLTFEQWNRLRNANLLRPSPE